MTTEQCQALGQESLGSLLFFFFPGRGRPSPLPWVSVAAVLSSATIRPPQGP